VIVVVAVVIKVIELVCSRAATAAALLICFSAALACSLSYSLSFFLREPFESECSEQQSVNVTSALQLTLLLQPLAFDFPVMFKSYHSR
jgi:hypothetical protein